MEDEFNKSAPFKPNSMKNEILFMWRNSMSCEHNMFTNRKQLNYLDKRIHRSNLRIMTNLIDFTHIAHL